MSILRNAASRIRGALSGLRGGSDSPAHKVAPARSPDAPIRYLTYTPAKGYTHIYSERRQSRKQLAAVFTSLKSGRQWVKYRKAAKRLHRTTNGERGFDYFALPTYRVAP